jgi:hypothetical protein
LCDLLLRPRLARPHNACRVRVLPDAHVVSERGVESSFKVASAVSTGARPLLPLIVAPRSRLAGRSFVAK